MLNIYVSLNAPVVEEPSRVGNFGRKSGDTVKPEPTEASKRAQDRADQYAKDSDPEASDDDEKEEPEEEEPEIKATLFSDTELANKSGAELTDLHDKHADQRR